jgi:hypothetical protein
VSSNLTIPTNKNALYEIQGFFYEANEILLSNLRNKIYKNLKAAIKANFSAKLYDMNTGSLLL